MSKVAAHHYSITPRLIRLRDAPFYLGMDRNRFNTEVRPYLVEIQVGKQGVAFDRLDLDAWVDHYKSCNGRPGSSKGESLWDAKDYQVSTNVTGSGTSTSRFRDSEFVKVLERVTSKKQKDT
jgi:hypothetical protein